MFSEFAEVWTPVLDGQALKRKPLGMTLAGQPIVLFRDSKGAAAALIDRCPHRGVRLSLGQVQADGTLQCPFHGWQFAANGACVRVPLSPQAKCERLGVTALPTHEGGGLIWVYTGPQRSAAALPDIPQTLLDTTLMRFTLEATWKTHWTRAMENMLDVPHVPFVHRTTIGWGLRRALKVDSAMEVQWEATPTGGTIRGVMDKRYDAGFLEYRRPNGMVLFLATGRRKFHQHVFCIPVDDHTTRMMVISTRNFGRYNPLARLFDQANRVIVLQDQKVVESSTPSEVPPAHDEKSVATDVATLQFRKYYYSVLKAQNAETTQRNEV